MKALFVGRLTGVLFAIVGILGCEATPLGQGTTAATTGFLQPRAIFTKPALVLVPLSARQNVLAVKFKQDRKMRAYGGRVYDMGANAGASPLDFTAYQPTLASLNAYWYPLHHKLSEQWLDTMRAQGEANAGQELPDLNTTMLVTVPTGYGAQEVANLINSVAEVEYVEAVLQPSSASPGDLSRFQDYLHPWSGSSTRFSGAQASGINAEYVWSQFTTRGKLSNGTKIKVAVIERSINLSHIEMSAAVNAGGAPSGLSGDNEHGVAVASIIGGCNDGIGIVGIASQVQLYIVFDGVNTDSGDPAVEALDTAWNTVGAGGIINVSQAYPVFVKGNVNDGIPDKTVQFPITYMKTEYNTVFSINEANTTVVLAAGNSGDLLDGYDINLPIAQHPFTVNSSYPAGTGAIPGVVYVGASAVRSNTPLSRCDFSTSDPANNSSNYGYVVALQGWGEYVEAAGQYNPGNGTDGNYLADGDNSAYTGGFNGTAAATPMVTGALRSSKRLTYKRVRHC